MRRKLSVIVLLMMTMHAHAQDTLRAFKTLPMQARLLAADGVGNIYVVRNDNELLRFNENGDSTGFYKGVYNGAIEAIDATNPLHILLHYRALNKVLVLDRMLSPKWELDLSQLHIYNSPAVCMSVDGSIWVYDKFESRLRKINQQLHDRVDATDLRSMLHKIPTAHFMVEQDRQVYVVDTALGIFIFDQFANYLGTLPLQQIQGLQADAQGFWVFGSGSYYRFDRRLYERLPIYFPQSNYPMLHVLHTGRRITALYEGRLVIFR